MKKQKKSNLDEMQEQKLLKITERSFWLGFWGLPLVIVVQALLKMPVESMLGELVVLLAICLYMCISCIRSGIWDRHLKPNLTTNLLGSVGAGVFMAVFSWLLFSSVGASEQKLWMLVAVFSLGTTVLCFVFIQLASWAYKKRREKLDRE